MVWIMFVDRLSDEEVREIFIKYWKIVFVGVLLKLECDVNRVMCYFFEYGYEVYFVNLCYDEVFGRKCYFSVFDILDEVEIVDFFVRLEFIMDYVE